MDWIDLSNWTRPLIAAVVALLASLVAYRIGRAIVLRIVRFSVLLEALAQRIDRPAALTLPLMALQLVWQGVPDDVPGITSVRHFNGLVLIAALTWLAMAAVNGVAEGVARRHPVDTVDNLNARRIQTQARVLARIASGAVLLAGAAFLLMTFPGARQLGTSLLASAGVAGLVVGIAARPVFSNLVAGLQIALAQPIRIDDVLIVEGEWGRVEEITGTYVVLKIWDERRLIIPLQYLIEKPFQNWTRSSSQIIGTVFLWVDYSMPVEPLREALRRACEASPLWDKRVCVLQVTDASDRSMQLRALVSSASAGENWDLRCAVREALIGYVQREYPQALPRVRADLGEMRPATEG